MTKKELINILSQHSEDAEIRFLKGTLQVKDTKGKTQHFINNHKVITKKYSPFYPFELLKKMEDEDTCKACKAFRDFIKLYEDLISGETLDVHTLAKQKHIIQLLHKPIINIISDYIRQAEEKK